MQELYGGAIPRSPRLVRNAQPYPKGNSLMLSYNTWFSVRQYDAMNDEYVHIVRFPQHHLAWEYINKRGLRNAKVVREYF